MSSQLGNLRVPKVFVFNPSTELVTSNASKSTDLTLGQVGTFRADTGVGTGTTSTTITCPQMVIHQDVGDSKFGTVRSKVIHGQLVRGWHAKKAVAATAQVSYIGYDEVDNTKDLVAYEGQEIVINIHVYDNELRKWYGPVGYHVRLVPEWATCAVCQEDCQRIDQDKLADWIVAAVNGTNAPSGSYPTTLELKNYIVASKVTTGTQGQPSYRVGVKLTAVAYTPELLAKCDPQQEYKPNVLNFTVGIPQSCPNFPITYTTKAKPGSGWPLEVATLEKESQGYDRVRESFDHPKYMKNNYYIRATDGVKYDFYYLEFDAPHQNTTPVMGNKETKDPHIIIFAVPTGTGGNLETVFNNWLTPLGFAAVTISSSTGKGTAPQLINA